MTMYETTARLHATKLLGIAPSINDPYLFDDNGEHQSERQLIEDLQRPREELIKDRSMRTKTIDDRQYRSLVIEIGEDKVLLDQVLDKHGIQTLEDLTADSYDKVMSGVRRIKMAAKNELQRKRQ
jgi:hypothetical protein